MKSKEEILEAHDYDKGAPHWITKKAALSAMQAYADQQCKSEREKVLQEAIEVVNNLSVWTTPQWEDIITELNKLKQP